jgi:hypothetical protein
MIAPHSPARAPAPSNRLARHGSPPRWLGYFRGVPNEPIGDDLRDSLEVRVGREQISGLSEAMAKAQAPSPPG